MLKKVLNFIYKHEGLLGILGFIVSFLITFIFFKGKNVLFFIPVGIIAWLSAFLIGDSLNRFFKEGSIFPHRKDQTNKIRNLIVAALLMNLFSDASGSFFARLWYYPYFDFNFVIYLLLAPLGYVIFGIILYVFYRFFKKKLDDNVKPGRMSKIKSIAYKIIINCQLFLGVIGLMLGIYKYIAFYNGFNIKWYEIHRNINVSINIWYFVLLWVSTFFIMEFICYKLNRETLTRDLIRGDFIPLISIIFSSITCIVLIEFFNAPFQIWTFSHWPMESIKFMNIPLVSYIMWPMQYLILLPLIRIFDGKNVENVW